MEHLPIIRVGTRPHKTQNYDTAGNYEELKGVWYVDVSHLPDWRMEFLIALHELVEMALTKNNGVDWKDIDYFDTEGGGKDHPDPGSLETAPYHKEHLAAEQLERKMAELLGVEWETYNQALDALEY